MITKELGEPKYYPVHYGSNEQYSWTVGHMIVALTLRERSATIHILNTQLHEARHHTDHPIIAWIKDFVKTSKISDQDSYPLETEKQAVQAAEAITREFGDQITVKDWPVTEWNIDISDDKVVHLQVDYKNKEVDVRRLRWNY